MQQLGGKSVIVRTYESTVATGLFDDVAVVCDSEIIFEEVTKHGGKDIMSRKEHEKITYYEHIGIYAFRRETLIAFTQLPVSPLEAAEKIECLRYLENGIRMKMVVTDYMGVEIDTPEDLVKAENYLNKN